MAITALRLDGQTLGLQLDAASPSVDVLSLDVTTGTVTSTYLTDVDVRNLKATVDELFALVPLASRAAGALNLLTKFAAVSSADATSVTLSAVNTVGTTYALRATPSAVPSNLVVVLPFSPNGAIAPGSGSGGGGGGGVTNVTATAPIASSGGATPNITFTVAPGAAGNVLTSVAGAWASSAIPNVTLQQELFVAKNGSDLTGDGSLSKPYLTISKALTITNAAAANDYYRINVSPGLYVENLSVTKQRTMIAGCSSAPEQYQTTIRGTVTINPAASTDKFSDAVALYGCLISSNVAGTPTITITGTQAFGTSIDNCYVTTESTNSNAIFCDASNAVRPVIYVRNSIVTKQTNGATVPVIRLDRGDCRMDTVRVYASVTGASEGVTLANNATLVADRLQLDKSTSGAGILVTTAYAGISCTISNTSINNTYTGALPSPALDLNNSVGIAGYVWQCLFLVADTTANNAIDGTFNGATTPLIYGNLAYSPGTNTVITAAVNATKVPMTVIP